jgi:DNA mismatch endonuclease (patch repair protein)
MADTLSPGQRSERMSRIRGKDTAPELALRKALHALGLRYTLHAKLPGKPDIALPRHSAVVFVHGCFWHRHRGCRIATTPKTNTAFGREKFDRNVARDKRVRRQLKAAGWRVFVAWECQLSVKGKAIARASALAVRIKGSHG